MDSLLATYASSEEEEEEAAAPQQQNTASKSSSLFAALPRPKTSSLFSSLRNPKEEEEEEHINPTKPSSFFSSLPQPKTQAQQQPISIPKRVVQFKPPLNPSSFKPTNSDDDDDEDEEELERKKPRETESLTVTSFLSSIPPPRNSSTLGLVPSSSSSSLGSGRRSILETEPPVPTSNAAIAENESGNNQDAADYVYYDRNTGDYVNYAAYDQNVSSGSYENYGSYGDYGNNWGDGSASMVPQMAAAAAVVSDSLVRVPGKRRRNEIPMEIVEVKQDELMKDRPREDQVKLTGIAFGPSYQPVSTKGKPSKIHKRKHQIGTLYYDMKQREMELSERRAKGFLTKAETQAKYGW